MLNEKKMGPKIELCGTPLMTRGLYYEAEFWG